jgi:hypothetical protein
VALSEAQNRAQWLWFLSGLVILLVLSQTEPAIAGGLVLLIAVYLAAVKLPTFLAARGTSGTF